MADREAYIKQYAQRPYVRKMLDEINNEQLTIDWLKQHQIASNETTPSDPDPIEPETGGTTA